MSDELYSILAGTAGLSVAAVVAAFLTASRPIGRADPAAQRRLIVLIAVAIALQTGHFTEELATGFYVRFPELLGLAPWSKAFFVSFNLFWIAVWLLSIVGVRAHLQIALFPIWFLGVGCVANGVAHPVFSMMVGGYFPGLYTSPLVGLAGVFLLRRLTAITASVSLQQSEFGNKAKVG